MLTNINICRFVYCCLFIRLICTAAAYAQSRPDKVYGVKGKLVHHNLPVSQATVSLYTMDTVKIGQSVSNATGEFYLPAPGQGKYFIAVSHVSFQPWRSSLVVLTEQHAAGEAGTIILEAAEKKLGEIAVRSKQPAMVRKPDRLVVNVERTIKASGENIYELLKDLPGVTVSENEDVSINGKSGVAFMVDGKKVMLSGDQLKSLLRNTYAENVRNIEIIYTPPARYDAAGTAGMINIVTKKPVRNGFSGTYFTRYTQGRYGTFGTGINIASKQNSVTYLLNADYYNVNYFNRGEESRLYGERDQPVDFRQSVFDKTRSNGPSAKVGAEWQVTAAHAIGISLDGYISTKRNPYIGQTSVYALKSAQPDSFFITNNLLQNDFSNVNGSLFYNWQMDSTGKLTFNYDVSLFRDRQALSYNTGFYDRLGNPQRLPEVMNGDNPTNIDIHTLKLDYSWKKKHYSLEAGIKTAFINTVNDIRYFRLEDNYLKPDKGRTNTFNYREHIHAAYISMGGEWGSFSMQAGIRGEQTNTRGHSLTLQDLVRRSYFKIFPSLFLQKELGEDHTLNLSYSRRIQRPDYSDLNPFEFYFDPYSLVRGNPYLNPEFANAFDASYTFRSKYVLSVGYTASRDVLSSLSYQHDSTQILEYIPANLDSKRNLSVSLVAPFDIASWWESEAGLTCFSNHFEGNIAGSFLDRTQTSYRITFTNNFNINDMTSLQLGGTYNSASLQGISRYEPRGNVYISAKRYLFSKKATLRIAVSDVFRTDRTRGVTLFDNQHINFRQVYDSRKITLSFSVNLQKGNKVSRREQEAGNEEEKSRVTIGN